VQIHGDTMTNSLIIIIHLFNIQYTCTKCKARRV